MIATSHSASVKGCFLWHSQCSVPHYQASIGTSAYGKPATCSPTASRVPTPATSGYHATLRCPGYCQSSRELNSPYRLAIRRLPTPPGATLTQGHAAAYNPSAKHKFEEANSKSVGTLYRYRNYSDQIVVVSDPALENEVRYQHHMTHFHALRVYSYRTAPAMRCALMP